MKNVELIKTLSENAAELEKQVFALTGDESKAALKELNRTGELIDKLIKKTLDETAAEYTDAMTVLQECVVAFGEAQGKIKKIVKTIQKVSGALDAIEKLASKVA